MLEEMVMAKFYITVFCICMDRLEKNTESTLWYKFSIQMIPS